MDNNPKKVNLKAMARIYKGVANSETQRSERGEKMRKEKRADLQKNAETFETGLFTVEGMVDDNGKIDEIKLEEKILELAKDQMTDWSLINNERIDWVEKMIEGLARDTDTEDERNALEWALSEVQEVKKSRHEVRMQIKEEEDKAINQASRTAQEIAKASDAETVAFEEKRAQLEAMVNELGEKEDQYNTLSWFKRKVSAEGRTLAREIKELQKKSDELSAEIAGGPQINTTEKAA